MNAKTVACVVALMVALTGGASAAPIVWTGTTDGDWAKTGNWSPTQIPTFNDDLTFTSSPNTAILVRDTFAGTMTFDGPDSFSFSVGGTGSGGGTQYVNNGITVNAGDLTFNAGFRPHTGTFSVVNNGAGLLDFNGNSSFMADINVVANVTFDGSGNVEIQQLQRRNTGANLNLTKNGSGTLTIVNGTATAATSSAAGYSNGSLTAHAGLIDILSAGRIEAAATIIGEGGSDDASLRTAGYFRTSTSMQVADAGAARGTLRIDGGTFTVNGMMSMANYDTAAATVVQTGGDFSIVNEFQTATYSTGTDFRYEMYGGSLTVGLFLQIGRTGTGEFIQDGASTVVDINRNGDGLIVAGNGTGTYTLRSGTLNVNNGNVLIASSDSSNGVFFQYGGQVDVAGAIQMAGTNDAATGTQARYELHDGTLTVGQFLQVGRRGTGEFIQDGASTVVNVNRNSSTEAALIIAGTGTGTYTLSAGQLNVPAAYVLIGSGGGAWGTLNAGGQGEANFDRGLTINLGEVNLSGQASVNVASSLYIGHGTSSDGTLRVADDATLFFDSTGTEFRVGTSGAGRILQSGGTVRQAAAGASYFGGAGNTGRYEMTGGLLDLGSPSFGNGGTGIMDQQGGDVLLHRDLRMGRSGGTGYYTIADGTLTVLNDGGNDGQLYVGMEANSAGYFTQDGGIVDVKGPVTVSNNGTATGQYDLNAGELRTDLIRTNGGTASFLWSGGTIRPRAADLSVTMPLTLDGNAAVFNTEQADATPRTITVSSAIDQSGGDCGLTKVGAGTLRLNTANTYAGGTTIFAGTVLLGNNSALGSGTVTLAGDCELDITGARTLANAIAIDPGVTVTATTHPNMTFRLDGPLSGSGILQTGSTSGQYTLQLGGNNDAFTGTVRVRQYAGLRIWEGQSAPANGTLEVLDGGTAYLNKNASGVTYSVGTLIGQSGSIVQGMDNNVPRTLAVGEGDFAGSIRDNAGTVALTKTGPGTLVLSGANTYTGTTTINSGVLNIRHNDALGSTAGETTVGNFQNGMALELQGGVTVSGESLWLVGTGISGGGVLRSVSGNNEWAGPVTASGNNWDTYVGVDADSLTLSGVVSGNKLTKVGPGKLLLTAANTYTGPTTVRDGELELGSGCVVLSTGSGQSDSRGISVARSSGSALLHINGGTIDTSAAVTYMYVGDDGTASGTVIQDSGDVTIRGALRMAYNNAATRARYEMHGGTLTLSDTTHSYFQVGRNGQAEFIHDGGVVSVYRANDALQVGATATSNGLYALSCTGVLNVFNHRTFVGQVSSATGLFTVADDGEANFLKGLWLGYGDNATGTFRMDGGTVTVGNDVASSTRALIVSGNQGSGTTRGTLDINGGELRTNWITTLGDVAAFTWSGGTIRPYDGDLTISVLPVTLDGAGATFNSEQADTTPRTITVSSAIGQTGGDWGLSKAGAGTLVLSAANTYAGPTVIQGGTLALVHGSSNNITASVLIDVQQGATLDVTGLAGATLALNGQTVKGQGTILGTLAGGGLITPGASPGHLTATAIDPAGGMDFDFEFTNPTGDPTGNDMLILTATATPLASPLDLDNLVDVYFNVEYLYGGDTFAGGFRTSAPLSDLAGADWQYFVRGDGGGSVPFEGTNYYPLRQFNLDYFITFSQAQDGTLQLDVNVPEPMTLALLALATGSLGRYLRRRRR